MSYATMIDILYSQEKLEDGACRLGEIDAARDWPAAVALSAYLCDRLSAH